MLDAATSAINGLHLCEAAIHKQLGSRDVAAVVGMREGASLLKNIYYESAYKLHILDEILRYTQVRLEKVHLP